MTTESNTALSNALAKRRGSVAGPKRLIILTNAAASSRYLPTLRVALALQSSTALYSQGLSHSAQFSAFYAQFVVSPPEKQSTPVAPDNNSTASNTTPVNSPLSSPRSCEDKLVIQLLNQDECYKLSLQIENVPSDEVDGSDSPVSAGRLHPPGGLAALAQSFSVSSAIADAFRARSDTNSGTHLNVPQLGTHRTKNRSLSVVLPNGQGSPLRSISVPHALRGSQTTIDDSNNSNNCTNNGNHHKNSTNNLSVNMGGASNKSNTSSNNPSTNTSRNDSPMSSQMQLALPNGVACANVYHTENRCGTPS